MQLNLNYRKAILLLIPFVVALVLMTMTLNQDNRRVISEISNYLLIIGMLIPTACQAYMLIGFINATGKNDPYFKINALIPVFFLIVHVFYLIFLSFKAHGHATSQYHVQPKSGPVTAAEIHGVNLVIMLFLIYTFINFIFTNNNYVSWQIKKIADTSKQAELRNSYLNPMRILVRTALYIFGGFVLITAIGDVLRFV
ncbi:hypothetical protein ACEN9X_15655 [Mucilaginibacter sp. Mucisp86]|uniref:hypothetical protein n=1 Tax=Mucilaginibacter sp. Mucisp86 TaxID=3243060 RepID=UPI0039B589FE